jgi:hypothetical protein
MTELAAERVYRRHPDVSFMRFHDDMLVVVPRLAWQLVLNGTGARVFELLDGRLSVSEIATELAREFDGPSHEAMVADVDDVLRDLESKGAVEQTARGS